MQSNKKLKIAVIHNEIKTLNAVIQRASK